MFRLLFLLPVVLCIIWYFFLKQNGVDTRLFFRGMHQQPSLINYGCNSEGDFSITDWLSTNGFYLPSASNLSKTKIKLICELISKFHTI